MLRLKAGGISQRFDEPGWTGKLIESHASTCAHCQAITEYPSQKRMMEFVDICRGCMRIICLGCLGKPCVPAEKRAELAEAAARIEARIHVQSWRCY